jgi:hypothetical protein
MPTVHEITLERNCFGCTAGSVVVLRADGMASRTATGNARQGTADRRFRGTLQAQDFAALARLAAARGFFEMAESYDDEQTRDGAWSLLAFSGPGFDKRVFSRDGMAPPALQALIDAVEAAQSRIRFAPGP